MHTSEFLLRNSRIAPAYALRMAMIVLFSAFWLLIDVDETHASTCEPISRSEAFDRAIAVFSGKVIAVHKLYRPTSSQELSGRRGLSYLMTLNDSHPTHLQFISEFEVDTIWKGPNSRYKYVVRSFALGKRYLVYLNASRTTRGCDASHLISPAIAPEVLETLGAGQPATAGTRAPRPLPGWHSKDEMLEILFDSLDRVHVDQERERQQRQRGTPGWLIPTAAGVAGVLVGTLATTLTLRRRRGGT